jgi:hypothetical protein
MKTTERTAQPRTPRRVEHLKSYGPLLRLCDRIAGWRDRRLITTEPTADDIVNTPYVARLQATYDEIDGHTFSRIQDECRLPATKLRELVADLRRLDHLIADAESSLAKLPPQPPADALTARNGGELHLTEHAVATRRSREHAARIAREQAALTKLRNERSHHLADGARHAAQLTEAFELGRSTSARLRHFYNRRVTSYARHARIPAAATPTVATPAWITQTCPWLPLGYDIHIGDATSPRIASGQ